MLKLMYFNLHQITKSFLFNKPVSQGSNALHTLRPRIVWRSVFPSQRYVHAGLATRATRSERVASGAQLPCAGVARSRPLGRDGRGDLEERNGVSDALFDLEGQRLCLY